MSEATAARHPAGRISEAPAAVLARIAGAIFLFLALAFVAALIACH